MREKYKNFSFYPCLLLFVTYQLFIVILIKNNNQLIYFTLNTLLFMYIIRINFFLSISNLILYKFIIFEKKQ